ncbi:hypothetical protein [Providencia alcalifaciens]|uniref:hypothetical protein n=1 Tax=Providencia alcalifaciens TaxID=126385 RepID=UPI00029C63A8|nr:hypothetical protein [Providencia alcalifaciens]EKT64309.1 hypothetical protein OO9_12965 [Providencia alcalifaciens Dmel2]
MNDTIRHAIECWASRPTWFSSHPMDVKELRQAISNLKKVMPPPTLQEIKEAIHFYVDDAPTLLGTPSDLSQAVHEFAVKIYNKL